MNMATKLDGFKINDCSDVHVYNGKIYNNIFPPSALEAVKHMKCYPEDVVVASYPKSGTTWVSAIAWLVMNEADYEAASRIPRDEKIPYLEAKFPHKALPGVLEMPQVPGRVMKTHLSADFLAESISKGQPRVIVVIRDVKDTINSYYHHACRRFRNPYRGSWDEFFEHFQNDKMSYGDWGEFYESWWEYIDKPNFLVLRYEELLAHPREGITQIAEHCKKTLTEQQIDTIQEHTSFKSMKENMGAKSPMVKNFFRKGVVGDWQNCFSQKQLEFIEEYESKQHWLRK